ncbi:MAG: (d)CMP kinase [Clostridiales bacterium]|nr:(d)CMP kinase [Clostridiales bacterium]
MQYKSIAIDGPSGAGKSTLAKRVARALGFVYVDTGAIYRTVAYHIAMLGIGPRDKDGVRRVLADAMIEIRYDEAGEQHMWLNGADVTAYLRTPEISDAASKVAALPEVREFLLQMQREAAKRHNVVMDGRDIGTVVLPHADVKIFLTASDEVRAQRRQKELEQEGERLPLQAVLQQMYQRDRQDIERKVSPLRCAEDAVILDTTHLDLDQAEASMLVMIEELLKG